eukprot:TRINITY_DN11103_c0_g2_i3.p1 TRINITY_DN11103_c0_g2~~TRINITY_DN11103_c0_g2_i3.p1  ORF type:complete len:769 (+),score=162.13 TRINITY_DN11103_c0_g2_i3:76-2382(+)
MAVVHEPAADWPSAVRKFHGLWFPEPSKVQHFWFGARRPGLRPFFNDLINEFEAPLRTLASQSSATSCSLLLPYHSGGLLLRAGLPCRALCRLRLCTCIFLDQMCRNIESVRGDAELKPASDCVAISLALAVVFEMGLTRFAVAAALDSLATPAELCFLSLVVRHSRQQPLIAISREILLGLLAALPSEHEARELCSRFFEETEDAYMAVEVEAYLERALTSDEPLRLVGAPDIKEMPRLAVLDAKCRRYPGVSEAYAAGGFPPFLPAVEKLGDHSLIAVLEGSLKELGMLSKDKALVLSLSGGVDSMVTCCLLWLLWRRLPAEKQFRWCAMHLRHPNRDDAIDEEGWVRWCCDRLGVNLFTYRPQLRRPHGTKRTGISRERYEEKSNEIRFRMYARCLAHLGASGEDGAAIVAHHQDDADENRLAELGKSNLLHIDGMAVRGVTRGVVVLRPLLSVRKAQLIAFAETAAVCYMRDSTPKWSRRGWTRRGLDDLSSSDAEKFSRLLQSMTRAGAASEEFASALDASLLSWRSTGVFYGTLDLADASGASAGCNGSKKKKQPPAAAANAAPESGAHNAGDSVPIVVLSLPQILELATRFEGTLADLRKDITDIAAAWNAVIRSYATVGAGSQMAASNGDVEAECSEEDNDAPGACPLQKITVHESDLQAGLLLLTAAVYSITSESKVRELLRGLPIAKKALAHIWDSIQRARSEWHFGSIHKRCPCVYLRDHNCLVLFDGEGRDAKLVDKRWQGFLVRSAIAFVKENVV